MAAPRGVTLKLATSLDGRIATALGESRWITSAESRQVVHRMRADHDVVLVGLETALVDDPELTVRLDEYDGPQPARGVLDSRQRLPLGSRLVQGAKQIRTLVLTTERPSPDLLAMGVEVIQVAPNKEGRPDPVATVAALTELGMHRIMIEGGGRVAVSFLGAGLVDRIEWFRAPIVLGAGGRAAVGVLAMQALADAPRFARIDVSAVGPDLWERYERA